MTLAEAIAFLATADRAEVQAAIEKDLPGLYQQVFQKAHDVGYGKKAGELTKAEAKIAELGNQITGLETKVAELGTKSPDIAKLHEQYGQQIRELTAAKDAEVSTARGELNNMQYSAGLNRIRNKLVGLGLDPDYAEAQLERPTIRSRIKNDGGGKLSILQAGKDIPIAGESIEQVEAAFAKELFDASPAKFRVSGADSGAGAGADTRGEPGAKPSLADEIRKEVADKQAADMARHKAATNTERPLVLGSG